MIKDLVGHCLSLVTRQSSVVSRQKSLLVIRLYSTAQSLVTFNVQVYKEGFNHGRMLVGEHKGMKGAARLLHFFLVVSIVICICFEFIRGSSHFGRVVIDDTQ